MQRTVVGQQHPAGPDADPLGAGRDVTDQHLGRGAGDAADRMVLGDPEAVIAEPLDVAGEDERLSDRLGGLDALADRRLLEHGVRGHVTRMTRSLS